MRRLKLALVLNRFWPEVGGVETNLYFQARELARRFDVTVFTPRRLADEAEVEEHAGFVVHRLPDWLNRSRTYPNLGARTLMPALLPRLLRGRFDVVQVFPSLSPNSLRAFLVTRITRTPMVLCSFDFLDYASLIRENSDS